MSERVKHFEWTRDVISVTVYQIYQTEKKVGNKSIKPRKYKVIVRPNISIKNFMEHLKLSNCIIGQLSLQQNGPKLESDTTLEENGIRNGSELYLKSFARKKKPKPELTYKIEVKICDAATDSIKFDVSSKAQIKDLAHMVQDECGMPVDEQVWLRGDKPLENKNAIAVAVANQLKVKWLYKGQIGTSNPVRNVAAQNGMYECYIATNTFLGNCTLLPV